MKPHIWTAAAALLLIFSMVLIARTAFQVNFLWPLLAAGVFVYAACLILARKAK